MTVARNCTKGPWSLQEVRDQILSGEWRLYSQKSDPGEMWAWGVNSNGQLGDNTVISRSSPVQIPGTLWTMAEIGIGSMGLKSDGTLWSWGYTVQGSLMLNVNQCYFSSPIQVPGTNWGVVSTSSDTSFAIKKDGTLWGSGVNASGQMGQGNTCTLYSSPVQIPGTDWATVSAMNLRTIALKNDGTLWNWGFGAICAGAADNWTGCTSTNASSPIQIPGTNWVDVSSGICPNFAQKSDGTLWVWGRNCCGSLGVPNSDPSSPVQIPGNNWLTAKAINRFSLALKRDGTLWSWGHNICGLLGINDTTIIFVCSPVQVPGNDWIDITGSCAVSFGLKRDGTLWSWGFNSAGALGDNTTINKSSPIQIPGNCWIAVCTSSGRTSGGLNRSTMARKKV